MVKKYTSEILLVNIILTVGLFVFCFFFNSKEEVVYVDSLRLFNEFKMTKEIMKVGKGDFKRGKEHLDSLYVYLNNNPNPSEKERIVREIAKTREVLDEFQRKFNLDSSEKIWKRIKEYSKMFSEQKGYRIIQGYQNNGDIIYGDLKNDITDNLLEYINKRYEGLN